MEGGIFRVRCLLGLTSEDFPSGVAVFKGSKIGYKGFLEGFGRTLCRMIVEVSS